MSKVHGRHTFVSLAGVDLSDFCNTSEFGRKADKHDTTCYGDDDHVYEGGLGDGSATIGGIYDNTAAGPRDTIEPLVGTVVAYIRRVEGTGSGKPEDTVDVLVEEYVETSPVADMVTWTATLQPSGSVASTNQA